MLTAHVIGGALMLSFMVVHAPRACAATTVVCTGRSDRPTEPPGRSAS
jgi:hypothetical protein